MMKMSQVCVVILRFFVKRHPESYLLKHNFVGREKDVGSVPEEEMGITGKAARRETQTSPAGSGRVDRGCDTQRADARTQWISTKDCAHHARYAMADSPGDESKFESHKLWYRFFELKMLP